ncbi:kinase-like domain protein [Teratosphaeria destructans]|uniref:non-specific serine/threonine protein kinase n=1 Tax=Teratosphaeria destructans TaxID=418781 RepID=A0A9W7W1I0_9PEZI|nr:kinase-like domain protein [Teratosphaeria destructans]
MAKVWAESVFHGYGSNACIRSRHHDRFPIVKLTHPHTAARHLIQHEFRRLKELATTQVPIPQFDEHPLEDEDGVFAYSMELLHRIPYEESKSASYAREVEDMVTLLHEQGFAHGDLSPSNVMRNSQGRLVSIDFGFTGRLGQDVPACVPRWVYRDDTVHARGDDGNLLRLFPFQQCRSTL